MPIKNYREVGENLQKIMKRLMANQTLCKLLYYTDKDPLSQPDIHPDIVKHDIFENLIKVVPKLDPQDEAKSMISLRMVKAYKNRENREFRDFILAIEVFVPLTQWFIKSENLRPYLIMGEIQESLEGKTINGMGKIEGGDFDFNYLTTEMSCFEMTFYITTYD